MRRFAPTVSCSSLRPWTGTPRTTLNGILDRVRNRRISIPVILATGGSNDNLRTAHERLMRIKCRDRLFRYLAQAVPQEVEACHNWHL
jgi:hypothetical protein